MPYEASRFSEINADSLSVLMEFHRLIRADQEKYAKAVKEAGVKLD